MKKDLQTILSYTNKTDTGCLVWTRCFNTDGYPRAVIDGNFNAKVHRIVYELYNKIDISGLVVRHTCDNTKCINPEHLIIGTNLDNIADRVIRDRSQGLKKKDVETIRYLYSEKICTVKQLAAMFDCAEQTIRYSLTRRK